MPNRIPTGIVHHHIRMLMLPALALLLFGLLADA